MSNSKMLIDATHPEETRVVVQRNGRVEEFDFESAARKLLRGNIYLAKVTRVEPSLQAAFVDYGGNRHGFLAFNEIHPDYYQIPVADRQALLDEEAAAEAELEAAADRRAEALARRSSGPDDVPTEEAGSEYPAEPDADSAAADPSHIVDVEEEEHIEEIGGEAADEDEPKVVAAAVEHSADDERSELPASDQNVEPADDEAGAPEVADEPAPEAQDEIAPSQHGLENDSSQSDAGFDDGSEEDGDNGSDAERPTHERTARPRRRPRSYKIQEVIKRRQIILVQVVKEERGNKGAALTTYLSLAGRYTVLMPNTARGGGISRKITNPQDRRRLKSIAQDLEVPEGMGLIIRTAGAARTKQEIKRDFEYLLRLWESVRELTLQSTAPNLVYEEGDLIKRSIRDLYNKDVEEIVVAGEAGYQEAAAFMKMLMPSHARNVSAYGDPTPLFTRYGVERQLNAMFQPQVTLKSGGYIVINQTEALVAIDVNSGKSTREFSIEETALATNLEAADEIARQLKLRDLAGLIVIDFIDMEEKRNNRAVERRLKDALRFDRARIQLGRISHFGLMEMSRQRLRTGVLEGSTSQCPHCMGTGIIRSTESVALAVLRGLEDAITAGATGPLIATTTPPVALYILNSKRPYVADMEGRHGHTITVLGSDRVHGANFTVERGAASVVPRRVQHTAVNMDWGFDTDEDEASLDNSQSTAGDYERDDESRQSEDRDFDGRRMDGDEGNGRRGRRRRRRGRGGRDRNEARDSDAEVNGQSQSAEMDVHAATDEEPSDQPTIDADAYGEKGSENDRERSGRRRRRGRRGGRRGRDRKQSELAAGEEDAGVDDDVSSESDVPPATPDEEPSADNGTGTSRKPSRRRAEAKSEPDSADDASAEAASDAGKTQRQRRIWDTPSTDNNNDEQATEPAAAANGKSSDAAGEPDAVPPPQPVRRRHESGSSEPRLERVVVKPGEREDNDVGELQTTPQRKGWWQRKFGGE